MGVNRVHVSSAYTYDACSCWVPYSVVLFWFGFIKSFYKKLKNVSCEYDRVIFGQEQDKSVEERGDLATITRIPTFTRIQQ